MPVHVNMLVVFFSPIEKLQVYLDIKALVGMWIEPFKYIMQPHKNIEGDGVRWTWNMIDVRRQTT
jgi:hypothetical protein